MSVRWYLPTAPAQGYLVAVSAATAGNLTLALADDHDIADTSGNRLAGGIPAGVNDTYVLAEPPRRTCP